MGRNVEDFADVAALVDALRERFTNALQELSVYRDLLDENDIQHEATMSCRLLDHVDILDGPIPVAPSAPNAEIADASQASPAAVIPADPPAGMVVQRDTLGGEVELQSGIPNRALTTEDAKGISPLGSPLVTPVPPALPDGASAVPAHDVFEPTFLEIPTTGQTEAEPGVPTPDSLVQNAEATPDEIPDEDPSAQQQQAGERSDEAMPEGPNADEDTIPPSASAQTGARPSLTSDLDVRERERLEDELSMAKALLMLNNVSLNMDFDNDDHRETEHVSLKGNRHLIQLLVTLKQKVCLLNQQYLLLRGDMLYLNHEMNACRHWVLQSFRMAMHHQSQEHSSLQTRFERLSKVLN